MATDRGQWALQGGTTTLTMVPPAGHAQGDRVVLWAINKLEDKVPVISGLSSLAAAVVGLVASPAADVGQQRITVWEFDEGAAQGNVTITITSALNSLGGGYSVTPAAGEVFKPSTVLFASDVVSGTSFSCLMPSNQGFALNDRIIQIGTFTHGSPGLPGRGITLPGCTLNGGASTALNSAPQNTTGNHQYTFTEVGTVTAGSQSAAATAIATTTTATTGGAAHVRMSYQKVGTLGQATETDTAQPLARRKQRAALTASETDAATPVGRRKQKALGTAGEADAALAVARRKIRALGVALETSAAQAVGRWKTRLIGPAFESDDAQPVGRRRIRQLGTALEVDEAQPITRGSTAGPGIGITPQGSIEPNRWAAIMGSDRWDGTVEPDRYKTEVEAP